jgi:hypothetical protein
MIGRIYYYVLILNIVPVEVEVSVALMCISDKFRVESEGKEGCK